MKQGYHSETRKLSEQAHTQQQAATGDVASSYTVDTLYGPYLQVVHPKDSGSVPNNSSFFALLGQFLFSRLLLIGHLLCFLPSIIACFLE
jgi:hypothetical protein